MTASKNVKPVEPMGIWDVQGSFIIPGTREKVSFGPQRVMGKNKTIASAGLVDLLNETFGKELASIPRVAFQNNSFSKHFALYNLQWTPFVPKVVKANAEVVSTKPVEDKALEAMVEPVKVDDRNDPPALNA